MGLIASVPDLCILFTFAMQELIEFVRMFSQFSPLLQQKILLNEYFGLSAYIANNGKYKIMVHVNKNIKVSTFESNENTQRQKNVF